MKNTRFYIALICMLVSLPSMAQKTKIKEISGAPVEGRNRGLGWRNTIVGGFFYDGSNYAVGVETEVRTIYVMVMAIPIPFNPRVTIYKLDDKMSVAEKSNIDLMPGGQMVTYHSFKRIGDNFFIFFRYKNKSAKKHFFFCKRVSLLDKKEDVYKLAEFSKHGKGETISFQIVPSENNKKFAVITNYNKKESKKQKSNTKSKRSGSKVKNTTTFDYVVMDEEMKVSSYGIKINLETEDEEVMSQYYVSSSGKLIIVTSAPVDFADNQEKASTKTKGKKVKKAKKIKKNARRYFLHVYDNSDATKVAVSEDKYLRGYYIYPISDSTIKVFNYYSDDGQFSDGLQHATFNLNTKEFSEPELASFKDIKGAGDGAGVSEDDNDEDEDNPKSKKKKKTKKPAANKHDNVMKSLDKIAFVDKLKNGNFVVFGEIFEFWVEVRTTYQGNGRYTTTYINHYDYGPAGMVKVDSAGMVESSTIVDYKVLYTNYNPGFGALPMGVGEGDYLVVTDRGYSVVDFGKTTNAMKGFTSINDGYRRRGDNTIVRMENSVLMILNKKKSLTFSTIAGIERGAAAGAKKKKKK